MCSSEKPVMASPMATSHRASTTWVKRPTMGSAIKTTRLPGRKHQPAQQGRVAHKRLQEQGQQHGAAVEHEPQHEHGEGGEGEVPVFEHAQIHHGIIAV
jgi:hypothetical protein